MESSTIPEAQRLVLLCRLRMAGVLDDLTLRQIGEILGIARVTLLQDLQALDAAEAIFHEWMETQPWKEWTPSLSNPEATQKDDEEEAETIRRLVRDGLMWLENLAGVDAELLAQTRKESGDGAAEDEPQKSVDE
jgi:hypothetical protein